MEAGIRLFNTVISTQFCDVDNRVVGLQTPPNKHKFTKDVDGQGACFLQGGGAEFEVMLQVTRVGQWTLFLRWAKR